MYLKEVYVENFGVLKDYRYEPKKGFNYIYGDNGTGKSTFAEFVKAMLYGMPQTRNRKQLDEAQRKKYMPWNNGRCGGYIDFEAKGKSYRLSRYFGEKEKDDTFSLTDLKTGLESQDYTSNIGEELFGVDVDAYSSTVWISTRGMEFSANDSVHAKLGESMEFGADMQDCEKGLNRLDEAQKQYVRTGRRGLLYEAEDALAELEAKKREQELCATNIKEHLKELKEKGVKKGAVADDTIQWNDRMKKRLALLDDHFSKGIPSHETINKLIVNCQVQKQLLEQQEKRNGKIAKACKIVVGVIGTIAAIAMIIAIVYVLARYGLFGSMLKELFWALATIGSLAILLAFPFLIIIWKKNGKNSELKAEQDKLETKIKRCEKEIRLVDEYTELSGKEEAYKRYEEQESVSAYNQQVQSLSEKYEKSVSKLQDIKDAHKDCKKNIAEYKSKAEIVAKAKKYLQEAKNSYISNYKDNIADSLKEYVAVFDEELAKTIMMDTEFTLSVMEGAQAKEINYFSAGYKDIMWFCERLAIVDSVYVQEKPVLILDDAFASMDDKMLKKAMELLHRLSDNMQIIYMTCRESDKNVLKNR